MRYTDGYATSEWVQQVTKKKTQNIINVYTWNHLTECNHHKIMNHPCHIYCKFFNLKLVHNIVYKKSICVKIQLEDDKSNNGKRRL